LAAFWPEKSNDIKRLPKPHGLRHRPKKRALASILASEILRKT
jgi:hypothetical protein